MEKKSYRVFMKNKSQQKKTLYLSDSTNCGYPINKIKQPKTIISPVKNSLNQLFNHYFF